LRDQRRRPRCEVEDRDQKLATAGGSLSGELVLVTKTAEPVTAAEATERQ
jgi:hypothetical protein